MVRDSKLRPLACTFTPFPGLPSQAEPTSPSEELRTRSGVGSMVTGKRYALWVFDWVSSQISSIQWWDAVQQTNRPHGIAFSKINGGAIKNIKIWKASLRLPARVRDRHLTDSQPVGWNFATSGASNIQITGNTILAVSSTGVGVANPRPETLTDYCF